jgi:hypothetical protein
MEPGSQWYRPRKKTRNKFYLNGWLHEKVAGNGPVKITSFKTNAFVARVRSRWMRLLSIFDLYTSKAI